MNPQRLAPPTRIAAALVPTGWITADTKTLGVRGQPEEPCGMPAPRPNSAESGNGECHRLILRQSQGFDPADRDVGDIGIRRVHRARRAQPNCSNIDDSVDGPLPDTPTQVGHARGQEKDSYWGRCA